MSNGRRKSRQRARDSRALHGVEPVWPSAVASCKEAGRSRRNYTSRDHGRLGDLDVPKCLLRAAAPRAEHFVTLAKLTRPKSFAVLPRERIFNRLDEQCRHSAVWVCGPPGAGKTTLVTS